MTLNILIHCEKEFQPKARYVIETFLIYYQIEHRFIFENNISEFSEPLIAYISPNFLLKNRKNSLIFEQSQETVKFFNSNAKITTQQIEKIKNNKCIFECHRNSNFSFEKEDLIASSFFFLSAWQEITNNNEDSKGRFLAKDSAQAKAGKILEPLVDVWFEKLAMRLKSFGVPIKKASFPNNSSHILNISHDIDFVSLERLYLRKLIKKKVYNYFLSNTKKKYANLSLVLASRVLQRRVLHKIRKFTLSKGYPTTFNIRPNYNINDNRSIKKLCKIIDGSISEMGFHPDKDIIGINNIEKSINHFKQNYSLKNLHGLRIHELAFKHIELYRALEKTNTILYDHSMMFSDLPGYRTAFSLPHRLFLPEENKPTKCVSIPLLAMDTTFFKYMLLDEIEVEKNIESLLHTSINSSRIFSLLIHNNFFFTRTKKRFKLLEKWINESKLRGGSTVPTRKLFFWWKELENESNKLRKK